MLLFQFVSVESSCAMGFWGPGCTSKCNEHCNGRCNQNNGTCSKFYGCIASWWGKDCCQKCPENCNRLRCVRNDGTCSTRYGQCKSGWWGSYCLNKCPENCNRRICNHDGTCSTRYGRCKRGWCGSRCNTKCGLDVALYAVGSHSHSTNMTKNVTKNMTLAMMNLLAADKLSVIKQKNHRFLDSGQCGSGGSSIPNSCINPQAQEGPTSCDFYSLCLEKAHPCGDSGYALNYGKKFCKKFLDLNSDPDMTTLEKKWMSYVRQCLQDAAVSFVYDSSLTCSEIQTKAFATHVPCYIHGDGIICQNPSLWVQLVKVIGRDLLQKGVPGTAANVLGSCVSDPLTYRAMAINIGKQFLDVAKETVSFAGTAAKWIKDSVVNLVEGMYHWWETLSFDSKLQTNMYKGSGIVSSYKTSVQQMMIFLHLRLF